MSAAPKYPSGMGYAGLRMTADEYLALGETHDRYELIDGVVVMSPSPTPRHQRVAFLVAMQVENFAQRSPGVQVVPDVDVRMTGRRVYRPDVVVYGRGRLATIPERLTEPPELVMEVLSPGSEAMDIITKREDYDRFGVGEYWVVDPTPVTARVWRRAGGELVEDTAITTVVTCASVPGLTVDLAKVRAALGGR